MLGAVKAIEAATSVQVCSSSWLARVIQGGPPSQPWAVDLQVHDSILRFPSAALEITKHNCALDQGRH
jgi:hypothetical protein